MKRKHEKTLGLLYHRPISANIQWRDIEALLIELGAQVEEREDSRCWFGYLEKGGYFTVHTHLQTQARVQSSVCADG
jgi:hypothetical protein